MTGAGNWTWLIPGRVPTLIDAGVGEPRHLAALEEALGPSALDVLRQGHSHIEEVVARVYPQLREALAPRARETALAHLLKLERDGRVRRAGDAWHIIDGTSQGLARDTPSS